MAPGVEGIFGKPIVTQEEMRTRIRELGRQITADYAQKDLILIGILKGAFAFYADLARAIRLPLRVDFVVVSSYTRRSKSSGKIKVLTELTEDIAGRDVLLVEDIVRSEEHTSELQSRLHLVCRLLLEKKKKKSNQNMRNVAMQHNKSQ